MESRKDDSGKLPWDLLAFDALEDTVRVLDFGVRKYEPYNWAKGMAWSRCYAAALRHLTAWWRGEDEDPETGLPHLAHAACCIMFLQAYGIRGAGEDDRPEGYAAERVIPIPNGPEQALIAALNQRQIVISWPLIRQLAEEGAVDVEGNIRLVPTSELRQTDVDAGGRALEQFPRGAGSGTYFRRLPDDSWVMLGGGDNWVTVEAPTWRNADKWVDISDSQAEAIGKLWASKAAPANLYAALDETQQARLADIIVAESKWILGERPTMATVYADLTPEERAEMLFLLHNGSGPVDGSPKRNLLRLDEAQARAVHKAVVERSDPVVELTPHQMARIAAAHGGVLTQDLLDKVDSRTTATYAGQRTYLAEQLGRQVTPDAVASNTPKAPYDGAQVDAEAAARRQEYAGLVRTAQAGAEPRVEEPDDRGPGMLSGYAARFQGD